jgi:hypothetical protein
VTFTESHQLPLEPPESDDDDHDIDKGHVGDDRHDVCVDLLVGFEILEIDPASVSLSEG